MIKLGDIIFVNRNGMTYKTTLKNVTKKGSAICLIEGKEVIVSLLNVFLTEEEATKELDKNRQIKKQKENILNKKLKKIDEIVDRIWVEFGVTIRFLGRPSTVDEAEKLYKKLKNNKL